MGDVVPACQMNEGKGPVAADAALVDSAQLLQLIRRDSHQNLLF